MINIDELKKKILYRSQYRGTKEMDKLLSSFVFKYINEFNQTQLLNLEKFLDIDDESLYKFYNGSKTTLKFENNEINDLFKNFRYNQK